MVIIFLIPLFLVPFLVVAWFGLFALLRLIIPLALPFPLAWTAACLIAAPTFRFLAYTGSGWEVTDSYNTADLFRLVLYTAYGTALVVWIVGLLLGLVFRRPAQIGPSQGLALLLFAGVYTLGWTGLVLGPSLLGNSKLARREQLAQAIRLDDKTTVERLLRRGVDLNTPLPQLAGQRPMEWAITHKDAGLVRLLLERGGQTKFYGANFFYQAAHDGNPEIVQLFLDHGAAPQAALQAAADSGDLAVAELLYSRGAEVNTTNYLGETPLMAAVEAGHATMVSWLLDHGADPNLADNQGRTALARADANNPVIAAVLRQAGAQ